MDLQERKTITKAIPWVTHVKAGQPCTGWVSSASMTRGKRTCKNPAHWRFKGLKGRGKWWGNSEDGMFCWNHLFSRGLYGSMEEEARTVKWLRKHYPHLFEEKEREPERTSV